MYFLFRFFRFFFSPEKQLYRSLKNLLGFYPTNIVLYKKAFRHKSASIDTEGKLSSSNERLEYLGDAIFGAVIADFLFKKFPFRDEGFLTKMRSKIVSRSYLNLLAVRLGIDYLVQYQGDLRSKFKSINGDAFEALIGAIYLDKGYSFTKKFIINRIIRFHIDIDELENIDSDYKSKLINWAQKEKKSLLFNLEEESGSSHEKLYKVAVVIDNTVMGRGTDFSKKRAEQQAAEKAFAQILEDN